MGIQIPWGPMRAFHSLGTVCLEGGSHLCVGREFMSVYESFRVVCAAIHAVCMMGCSQGLAGAGGPVQLFSCVVRELCESDRTGRVGRFMSGQVGLCRLKSGEVGRINFSGLFCRYGFASVFSFLAPPPGTGKVSTTHSDARLTPTAWRLRGQSVVSGRFMSGQIGLCRVRTGNVGSGRVAILYFGLMRLTARRLARRLCWVMGR